MNPEDIAGVAHRLQRMREESGRDFTGFEVSLRAGLDLTRTELPPSRLPLRGSHEQVADDIQRYRDAGLTYLVLEPRARHATEFTNQIEQLANQVWPRL